MSNYNKVILMGNLTREAEIKTLAGGSRVWKNGLAINRRWRDTDGVTQEETTYVDLEFYGRQVDTLERYMGKGSGIHVEGRLKLDVWHDRLTGDKKSRLKVIGERFQFVGNRGDTTTAQEGAAAPPASVGDDNNPF